MARSFASKHLFYSSPSWTGHQEHTGSPMYKFEEAPWVTKPPKGTTRRTGDNARNYLRCFKVLDVTGQLTVRAYWTYGYYVTYKNAATGKDTITTFTIDHINYFIYRTQCVDRRGYAQMGDVAYPYQTVYRYEVTRDPHRLPRDDDMIMPGIQIRHDRPTSPFRL